MVSYNFYSKMTINSTSSRYNCRNCPEFHISWSECTYKWCREQQDFSKNKNPEPYSMHYISKVLYEKLGQRISPGHISNYVKEIEKYLKNDKHG